MKSYMDLGNKYISKKKARSFLVIASMVLATILLYVAVTVSFGSYMNERTKEEYKENYYVSFDGLSESQYSDLTRYANVESVVRGGNVADRLEKESDAKGFELMPKHFYDWYCFVLMELDSFEQDIFGCDIVEGRLPEKEGEIIISKAARQRFTEPVEIGDTITINCKLYYEKESDTKEMSMDYTLCGVYEGEVDDMWGENTGYVMTKDASSLSAYVRFKRKYHWKKDAAKLAAAINLSRQAGQTYENNIYLAAFYFQNEFVVAMCVIVLMLVLLIIYFCMVMIRSLMSTNVINKLKDYTILKSMGATNKQLRRIMMREHLIDGCIAYVLGVILGQLFISLVLVNCLNMKGLSYKYVWVALLFAALFLWATIELAAIEPFFMLKKLSIVDALGQRELIKKSKRKKKESTFYRKLSIEGQYAYKNMKRNRKQFWNAVASFTISILIITTLLASLNIMGLSVVDTMSAFLVDQKDPYDVRVLVASDEDGQADIEHVKSAMEGIRSRADVTEADYQAGFSVPQDEKNGLKYRLEAKQYLYTSGGDIVNVRLLSKEQLEMLDEYMVDGGSAYDAVKDGGVIVQGYGDTLEEKNIQFYDLKVGDRISIASLDSVAELLTQDPDQKLYELIKKIKTRKAYTPYVVKGISKVNRLTMDYPYTVIMSYDYVRDTYGEIINDKSISQICVSIDEKTFHETDFNNFVGTQSALLSWEYTDMRKTMIKEMGVGIIIVVFIVLFVLIMGVLNMLNSMVNEQLQRKKESAILRAIGMSRHALNKMLILEKMMVGFIAWFVGSALSVLLTFLYAMPLIFGLDMKFTFPWYLCGITAVVMFVLMAFLSWIMIVMVGKLDITEGIRNEG